VDEETGMTGAVAIKPGWLKGQVLLNLDSEDEGELCIGCAGGLDATFSLAYKEQAAVAGGAAFKLGVTGLKGGHSGVDIALGRGNANKVIARVLKRLAELLGVQVASLEGGNLRNAIPREAFAVVVVPSMAIGSFAMEVSAMEATIAEELKAVDGELRLTLARTEPPKMVADDAALRRLLNALCACPNGVIRMSDPMPGLVETSSNLAIVSAKEGLLQASCLLRSSVNSAKEYLSECMEAVFTLAGGQSRFAGGYPGWQPNPHSPILKVMRALYEQLYGAKPHVRAVHAGLECGLLGGIYPNLDMISFGPTILNPHSPDERVEIATVDKWWKFLLATLENAPVA
ncbi:MAG: beta-Ala-His dipeptidase, partial [Prevotellaceae bacterium]|jgi:dipeptidase D|nr:beta-Ala-His dipeptidase [Prevotellaceae bacterium]